MSLLYRGIFLFFFLLTITPGLVKAQDWEYGVSIGTSGYMGEYNQDNIFKFNSLSGSIGAKYNFNPTWGIRGNFAVVGINGNANYNVEPGLPVISADKTFKSKTLLEISVLPEFNFFKFEPNKTKNEYTPYVFAGIGARLDNIGSQHMFRRAIVPFGAGFKYNLKGSLSIDAQLSYRMTADDKLDDYPGQLPKKNDEKVRLIDKAINTDSYMSFQIGITYTFFKQGCPTW